jgi:ketosteroid isomerase-like protein
MSIEDNRKTAIEFYSRFSAGDIPGALALMADDATFWLAGTVGRNAAAGLRTQQALADLFRRMGRQLMGGLKMTVKHTLAEGDRVALEVESHGELLNGRVYNQEYHTVMTVREGKIVAVREYLDTQHVQEVWYTA